MSDDNGMEAFYDAEIAPVLAELAARCQGRGLSLIAVVEWGDGSGRTLARKPQVSSYFLALDCLSRCRVGNSYNLDAFMMWVEKSVGDRPHGSIYLDQLHRYRKSLGLSPRITTPEGEEAP